MKLLESKAEYLPQENGIEGIYKIIEVAGRTAYNSQDKITPDSAKSFVDRMIKSKHGACLEHGTVYLYCKSIGLKNNPWFSNNPYSKVVSIQDEIEKGMDNQPVYHQYITTNYRVIEDLKCPKQLQLLCSSTKFHEKRYTMRFTCSRAIAQELTRHRVFSFLMESQRYINYSKERHGGEITYIKPSWLNTPTGIVYWHDGICWRIQQNENNPMEWFSVKPQEGFSMEEAQVASTYFDALSHAEKRYFVLLREKCSPQQARDVLPNATKTELIMTGFASDYRHLLDLRLFGKTGAPHPDMINLMQKAQKAMQEAGIWEDIMSKPSKFD